MTILAHEMKLSLLKSAFVLIGTAHPNLVREPELGSVHVECARVRASMEAQEIQSTAEKEAVEREAYDMFMHAFEGLEEN